MDKRQAVESFNDPRIGVGRILYFASTIQSDGIER